MTGLELLDLVYRYLVGGFFIDLALFTFGVWGFRKMRGRDKP